MSTAGGSFFATWGARVLVLSATSLACTGGDGGSASLQNEGVVVEGLTHGVLEICADGPGVTSAKIQLRNTSPETVRYGIAASAEVTPAAGSLGPNESVAISISPTQRTAWARVSIVDRKQVATTEIDIKVGVDVRMLRLVEVVSPAIGKAFGSVRVENPTSYAVPFEPFEKGGFRLLASEIPALAGLPRPGASTGAQVATFALYFELAPLPSTTPGEDASTELTLVGERCSSKPLPEPKLLTLTGRHTDHASAIATGNEHTCAIGARGALYCWGSNEYAQLGRPVDVMKGLDFTSDARRVLETDVTSVSTGTHHTCAVRRGTVFCWGSNSAGQSAPSSPGDVTPVPAPVALPSAARAVFARGVATCAVLEDRSVLCWGMDWTGSLHMPPTRVETLAEVEQVVLGDQHRCARRVDGSVACWGKGGLVGDGTTVDRATPVDVLAGAKEIAARANQTLALDGSGALFAWGWFPPEQRVTDPTAPVRREPPTSGAIQRIFAARNDDCYLTLDDGYCRVAGSLMSGSGHQELAAGDTSSEHACVNHDGGKISCVGANDVGQLGKVPNMELWRHGFD